LWKCTHCSKLVEDSFEVCWNCGASRSGEIDPEFQRVTDAVSDTSPPIPRSATTPVGASFRSETTVQSETTVDSDTPAGMESALPGPSFNVGYVCLWVAQVGSILGCIGSVCYPFYVSASLRHVGAKPLPTSFWVILLLGCFVSFCYSYSMALVFSHVRNSRP